MAITHHAGIELDENDWLTTPNLVPAWHIYLKEWVAARDILEEMTIAGDVSLREVILEMQGYIDGAYGREHYPNVIISGVPIEQFYPSVSANEPQELVSFDGGNWYMHIISDEDEPVCYSDINIYAL